MKLPTKQTAQNFTDLAGMEFQKSFAEVSKYLDASLLTETMYYGKALLLLAIFIAMLFAAGCLIFS